MEKTQEIEEITACKMKNSRDQLAMGKKLLLTLGVNGQCEGL